MLPPLNAALSHVSLYAPDVARAAAFYTGVMGLTPHATNSEGVVLLGWNRGHHAIELRAGSGGIDHVAFEVPQAEDLDRLVDRLDAWGTIEERAATDEALPRTYIVCDPDGHRIEFHGAIDRTGEYACHGAWRPIRVQHVTLGSPDMAELVAFYVKVVGFRVSDYMEDTFTWLRSSSEHHSLAIVSAGKSGLDHYAFDVDGWEDIKVWCDRLAGEKVAIDWGPGRHGPGNNLFVLFRDPAGNRVELSAEMEKYWDDRASYAPRRWKCDPTTVNLWGTPPGWR